MIRVNKHGFSLNKNLALFSGVFILLGILLLFTVQKFSPLIGHVAYYCQSILIDSNMIPVPNYLSIVPFALLLIILITSVVKFLILNIKGQFLKFNLRINAVVDQGTNRLIKRLGLQDKVVLVKSDKQFAFCLGVRNPKIYFSTELSSRLSIRELEAVLRHEQYHLEKHDTFTMIVASVVRSLFPFFPLIGDLIKKYRIDREIEADKFAIKAMGDQNALISVLKKLLAFPTIGTIAKASIADQDTLEPRIYSLVKKPYYRRQFKLRHLFITLLSTLILVVVITIPVYAQELHHEDHDVVMLCTDETCMNSCMSKKNLNKLYSEIPSTEIDKSISSQFYSPSH